MNEFSSMPQKSMRNENERGNVNGLPSLIFRTEKVFVGNLPPTVTRTTMRKHFCKYGKITDCVIMVNKDGSGRGFGFCEFEDSESVDRVIQAWNDHFINGQWVEVKRASPENGLRKYLRGVKSTIPTAQCLTNMTATSSFG
ncbi:heterogeneous nuclear ribonucleoprotein 27C-like [Hylaeus volcanicus]|uniref:heterogeneous nuclear ribonucleoprotein 27C-like n=1 Tax=Hylaeus volcanicus TaxID=313075 RepID=UPI0023B79BD3|nr:heterogeneous nuclear ribonucleoprotein 27C-like [Hylaeus volcanicus]XP_053991129.1 heterogeneous nuclear ribonucleoprotein 27C-like [Hylaeus volcanicus]